MCKCGNDCGTSTADLQEQLTTMQETVDALTTSLAAFINGHPILNIDDADDIALFDSNGIGSGAWLGWAYCDGNSYPNADGSAYVSTPNMLNSFVVGALGTYAVGDTGGAATVTLTIPNLPAHNHAVTDPGHTHTLTDPGHIHAVTDPQHSHVFSGVSHTHAFTTDTDGAHTHNSIGSVLADVTGGTESVPNLNVGGSSFGDHLSGGSHTHGGTTDSTTAAGTNADSSTGISINTQTTGATVASNTTGITTANAGTDTPVDILPPYYALIFVKKIF